MTVDAAGPDTVTFAELVDQIAIAVQPPATVSST